MTKVTVGVTLDLDYTDPTILKDLARRQVEAAGFTVGTVRIPKGKDPKPFQPKPWQPGMEYVIDGVRYQVWSETPRYTPKNPVVWAVPVTPREDGAPLVELSPGRYDGGKVGTNVRPVTTSGGGYVKPEPVALAA